VSNSRAGKAWTVIFALLLITVALGGYFGPQCARYLELRERLTATPVFPRGWDATPRSLINYVMSPASGVTVSAYGYKFDVPWKEVTTQSEHIAYTETAFAEGQQVRFFNTKYFEPGPEIYPQANWDRQSTESRYEQYRDVISMTPAQLSPFCSHREFARDLKLLDVKGTWFEHNSVAPDILTFATSKYRGFEFDDSPHGPLFVNLVLFDTVNRMFQITLSVNRGSEGRFTQQDVNRIIQSFASIH
jgi:hypothetical protein